MTVCPCVWRASVYVHVRVCVCASTLQSHCPAPAVSWTWGREGVTGRGHLVSDKCPRAKLGASLLVRS